LIKIIFTQISLKVS